MGVPSYEALNVSSGSTYYSNFPNSLSGVLGLEEDNGHDDSSLSAATSLLRVILPVVHLTLVVVGNSLSGCIMYRMVSSVSPLCAYPVVLAATDTAFFALDTLGEHGWLTAVTGRDIYQDVIGQSDSQCKTYKFTRNFLDHFTSWIVVCIGIESYISTVASTTQKRPTVQRQRIKDTIIMLTASLTVFNIHYFWTYVSGDVELKLGSDTVRRFTTCTTEDNNLHGRQQNRDRKKIIDEVHWFMSDIVPLVAIFILLVLVVYTRKRHAKTPRRRRGATDNIILDGEQIRRNAAYLEVRDYTFGVLLAGFIVCHLPYVIMVELNEFLPLRMSERESRQRWALAMVAVYNWWYFYWSGKIFIYVFSSRNFRSELRLFFKQIKVYLVEHMCVSEDYRTSSAAADHPERSRRTRHANVFLMKDKDIEEDQL